MTQPCSWLMGLAFLGHIALARDQPYRLPERKILHLPSRPGAAEQAGKEIERREEFVTGQLGSPGNMDRGAWMRKEYRSSGQEQGEMRIQSKVHAREKRV